MDTVREDRLSGRGRERVRIASKLQKNGKTLKCAQTKVSSYDMHDYYYKHTKLHLQLMLAPIMFCISLVDLVTTVPSCYSC